MKIICNTFKIKTWHFGIAFISLVLLTNIIAFVEIDKDTNDVYTLDDLDLSDIDNLNKETSFILLYTENSKPCNIMEQNLGKIRNQIADTATDFRKINLSKQPDLYHKYNISGVPSILILKEGKEQKRIVGVTSESNLKFIYNKTTK